MSLAPGRRLGPYEIVAPLGAGGMGEVFRARDTRLGREVALKVLPEAFAQDRDRRARFEREARAVAALSHPHIVALHDVGEEQGMAYAVTELLEGETLRAALRRGPLPVRKAVEQAVQVARGLAAAHDKGIVHRDLKPENVFVTAEGTVKILDFGLARLEAATVSGESEAQTVTRDTAAGVALGTVGYMSPEQVQGQGVDHRSDVFSLGCVLYEMLTGRRAFERPTGAETMTAILREDPPPLSGTGRPIPAALERTVHRCLEKSPAERFQSARDVAFALEAVSGDSQPSGLGPAGVVKASRRRLWAVAALGVALAMASGLGFLAGRRSAGRGSALSYERLTQRQGPILSARFGPDGRTVFYGAAWEGGLFRIYQTRPEGGELALPMENADLLSVSRDGQLAVLLLKRTSPNPWWKIGTLAVLPSPGAAPRELAEGVWGADFAPDGRSLAIVRQSGAGRRLEYPVGKVQYETRGNLFYPRVSPDGERVAFFEIGRGGVMLATVDRQGHRSVLVDGWEDYFDLVWAADGREIWFAAVQPCGGLNNASLHAVDLRGHRRPLAEAPGAMDIHDLAADGRALVAQLYSTGVLRGWTAPLAAERTLWPRTSGPIDFSPAGESLLFSAYGECKEGQRQTVATYYLPLSQGQAVRVTDGVALALSPDGRFALLPVEQGLRLVPTGPGDSHDLHLGLGMVTHASWMAEGDRLLVAAEEADGRLRLHVVDNALQPAPSPPRPVSAPFTRDPLPSFAFRVSPDGRRAAITEREGRILVVPLDGSEPYPLPGAGIDETPVQWSPDGRSLYCYGPRSSPPGIYRIDIASGDRALWREIRSPSPASLGVFPLLSRNLKAGAYGSLDSSADLFLVTGLR